jgi:hypothetical protein
MRIRCFGPLVIALGAALAGCAHSTPVTPAPLAADETARLQNALLVTCTVTATQKQGGERKEAKGLSWTFGPDGQGSYSAMGVVSRFTYHLDGRNVLTDGPYKAIRVDDFSGPTMKWFLYDTSETYYCTRQ